MLSQINAKQQSFNNANIERESMEFDVVIVGGGVAGLCAAIRLKQLNGDLNICVLEKAAEFGGHILSGAVIETRALDELLGQAFGKEGVLGDIGTPAVADRVYYLPTSTHAIQIPDAFVPKSMHNAMHKNTHNDASANRIVSLGNVVRALARHAESLDIMLFAGFTAAEILYNEQGAVIGVQTGDMGLDKAGVPKNSFEAGYNLLGKYTLFAEGCRGHLGKRLISRFGLQGDDPQHYAIGLKELWRIDPAKHELGVILHGTGYPLNDTNSTGGFWLYFDQDNQVSFGLVIDLAYSNPYMSPYDELQRLKLHPLIRNILTGGERISYGARALVKGGLNSLPKLSFLGGLLIGDDAGFLNPAKIKGTHTAVKSATLAAEAVADALNEGRLHDEISDYLARIEGSWLGKEMQQARSASAAMHRMGTLGGGAWVWLGEKMPLPTIHDTTPDYTLERAHHAYRPHYPKPDGVLTFDKMSSVFVSGTAHAENQPAHLRLTDIDVPLDKNLPIYDEPAQRYCPAGVYEVVHKDDGLHFVINAQNCVHCKTCDIKDPSQNITWVTPQGGDGPNYPNM